MLGVMVDVEVDFEVVCNLLFVSHYSGSWNIECINIIKYLHLLS